MAEERFSPVNQLTEIKSPLNSPHNSDGPNQPEDRPAGQEEHQTVSLTEQVTQDSITNPDHGETTLDTLGQTETEDLHLSLGESSKLEQLTQADNLSQIKESFGDITTTFTQADVTLELTKEDSTFQQNETGQSLLDEQPIVEYSNIQPIPLPKEGISYITSRNFLVEKGTDLKAKQPHEKRTYIIGQLPKGASENVFDHAGITAELGGPYQNKIPAYNFTGIAPLIYPVTSTKSNYRTVGPIIPRSQLLPNPSENMSVFIQPVNSSFNSNLRRSQERDQLHQLNDRFSVYVQHVRQLGEEFNHMDSSGFLKSCQLLEEQMQNLKNLYEKELENTRKQLDDANREKNFIKLEADRHEQMAQELQSRLSGECERSARLKDELNTSNRRLAQLEQEVAEVKASQSSIEQVHQLQRDIGNLSLENQTLRGRYEQEHMSCREAQDLLVQLDKQTEFQNQINQSTVNELQDRLQAANQNILVLESKVRELNQPGSNLSDMLQKVREAAAEELQKYQTESEARFNKNITTMRAQIEEDSRRINSLRIENEDYTRRKDDLENQIRALQSKLNGTEHQINTLKETMVLERGRYATQISNMERKARQLQELLLDKMHEANMAREMQIPLKAELEAFKVLLEDEEKRLMCPPQDLLFNNQSIRGQYQPQTTSYHATSSQANTYPITVTANVNQSVPYSKMNPTPPYPDSQPAPVYPAQGDQNTGYPNTFGNSQNTAQTCQSQNGQGIYYSNGITQNNNHNELTAPHVTRPNMSYSTSGSANITQPSYPPPVTQSSNYPFVLPTSTNPKANSDPCLLPTAPLKIQIDSNQNSTNNEKHDGLSDSQTTANVYTYETSPNVNRLNFEKTSKSTVGPVGRAKSAPVSRINPSKLGQGRDYFEEMFSDSKRSNSMKPLRKYTNPTSTYHDYNTATSSSTGDLKVLEVNQEGKYVRLVNEGESDAEIGGHMIQQNVGGHPVAVYRFQPHTRLPARKTVTIWCGLSDPMLHQPPTDFVWKEQQRWGTGPECTTILCKPNGQAIAWTTAAHRFSRNAFEIDSRSTTQEPCVRDKPEFEEEGLTELPVHNRGNQSDPVYLKREKQAPPCLSTAKHPHGAYPGKPTHPQTRPERPLTAGNDNSSFNRQSRSQTTTPDHPKGQPYAGPLSQRVESPVARSYAPPPGIVTHGSGKISNKAVHPGVTSMPPSAFMKPHQRFDVGLEQIQSQHHNYNSPMPRPPLYSAW